MKDTTFNMFIGIIVGSFIGASVVGISTKMSNGSERRLVITKPDGSEQRVTLYRGDDCRRWGEVFVLTAGPGFNYTCGNSG